MMEIRKSFPTDAYSLIQLGNVVWKNTYYDVLPNGILNSMTRNLVERVDHLKDQIMENNRVLVAVEEGQIVGFIFYAKSQNPLYDSSAEIREIAVLPDYQGKGIGRELFQRATEEVKKLGYHSFVLYCPTQGSNTEFFRHLGGEFRENILRDTFGYSIDYCVVYFDLDHFGKSIQSDWNLLYQEAQNYLYLLNDMHKEVAVVMAKSGKIYHGLGIKHKICPLEGALSNMYLGEDREIIKILILNRKSNPVLPCGTCRDLLMDLGQGKAEILFDIGTLQTKTMKELNPYYKEEEKV